MPRPDPRAPREGQESLIPIEGLAESRDGMVFRGRHSIAIDKAIEAAEQADLITDIDGAAATTLRATGWALDTMEARKQSYGPSKLVPAITELLREMRMTPESRDTGVDAALADLLADMGSYTTEPGNDGQQRSTAVHHTTE